MLCSQLTFDCSFSSPKACSAWACSLEPSDQVGLSGYQNGSIGSPSRSLVELMSDFLVEFLKCPKMEAYSSYSLVGEEDAYAKEELLELPFCGCFF